MVLAACPGKNVQTPQPASTIGKTAVIGRQFVVAGTGTARGIDSAIQSGILPQKYGVPVLQVLNKIGDQAVRLADILRAIDEAKTAADRSDALSRAKGIIAGFRSLLDSAVLPVADANAKAVIMASLSGFSAIIDDFSNELTLLVAEGPRVHLDLLALANELEQFPVQMARR
jgi:hypothetical protein